MLRRSYLTRAQEEKIRSDNRRREYEVEDRAKMIAQDRLLRYGSNLRSKLHKLDFLSLLHQTYPQVGLAAVEICEEICRFTTLSCPQDRDPVCAKAWSAR